MITENFVPLSLEQKKLLETLQKSADPTDRLKNGNYFYQLTKQALIEDYENDVAEATDLEDLYDARKNFDSALKKLMEDYEKDLDLWLQLHLTMCNIWSPRNLKIVCSDVI